MTKTDNDYLYQRGSEWRKWDLQACTKSYCSYKGPTFSKAILGKLHKLTGIEKKKISSNHEQITNNDYAKIFIEYLVNFSDIDVIGITNHNTGEEIDEILKYLASKKDYSNPKNIYNRLTIFPGVEIGCNDRCHILLIFNPDTKVKHKFKYDQSGKKTSEKNWREYISDFLDEIEIREPRFSNGKEPHNSPSKCVEEILNLSEKWDFIPIFPHINKNDGWWKELQVDIRRITFRHKMFGIVDSESINTNQTLLQILDGKGPSFDAKKVAKIYTSDADSITKIGEKFTWIKADPTFDGLKQIIYEPNERVRIQPDNPIKNYTKYVVDELEIKSSQTKLLEPQKILFNRNLICIIGGKGTGKSTLLALVANASEKYNPHPVFENKSTKVNFQFLDKDDKIQKIELDVAEKDNGENLPILYIEQAELADKSSKKTEVRQAYLKEIGIEDVSINYVDTAIKIGSCLDQITEQKEIIDTLKQKVVFDPDKHGSDFKKYLQEKIKKLKGTIKLTSTESTKEIIESIRKLIKTGRLLGQWLQDSGFTQIQNNIEVINKSIFLFNKRLKDLAMAETISEFDFTQHRIKFDSIKKTVEAKLKETRKEYLMKKQKLEAKGVREDIPTLLKTLETIQNELMLSEETENNFNEAGQNIENLRQDTARFYEEDLREGVLQKIEDAKKDINEKYSEFCKQRKESEIFKNLFEDVDIKADVFFDLNRLEKDITDCFFKDRVRDIKKVIFGNLTQDYKNYCKWIRDKFWKFYSKELENNEFKTRLVGEELDGRNKILEIVFRRWHEYITVSTAIINNFNGKKKEIKEMSTGELATVLLKLKLVTEGINQQIILLDQPEDHLDNDFIANGLVNLIKKLKLERQVIIVTHNANLVVGADAEQIIVAKFDQEEKKYFSGSLENSKIRNLIINILEGGSIAFEKRMNRYNLIKK